MEVMGVPSILGVQKLMGAWSRGVGAGMVGAPHKSVWKDLEELHSFWWGAGFG